MAGGLLRRCTCTTDAARLTGATWFASSSPSVLSLYCTLTAPLGSGIRRMCVCGVIVVYMLCTGVLKRVLRKKAEQMKEDQANMSSGAIFG